MDELDDILLFSALYHVVDQQKLSHLDFVDFNFVDILVDRFLIVSNFLLNRHNKLIFLESEVKAVLILKLHILNQRHWVEHLLGYPTMCVILDYHLGVAVERNDSRLLGSEDQQVVETDQKRVHRNLVKMGDPELHFDLLGQFIEQEDVVCV